MRVTEMTSANKAIYNIEQGRAKLDQLNNQIATGLQVSKPSDDPIATEQIMNANSLLSGIDQYMNNIKTGNLWLKTADSALTGISDYLQKIKDTAYTMNNGTTDVNSRNTAVTTLTTFRDQILQLGNTQFDGQYIFAGFKNNQPPFDLTDPTHTFQGTDDAINLEIDRGVKAPVNYSGGQLLRGGTPPGSSGTDIIGTIDNVINALNTNNVAALQTELPKLNAAFAQVQNTRSDLAGRMLRLQSTTNIHKTVQNNLKDLVAGLQNVDYARAITQLNTQNTAFEATLQATAKISQLSLLDYLR